MTAFRKIKHGRSGTTLIWTNEERGDGGRSSTTETTLHSGDDPRPEFIAALQALKAHVLDVCGLPEDYGDTLTISSVSISENESQGMGLVVTALKALDGANAPLVINTPHLPSINEHGPRLSKETRDAMEVLEAEADRFRRGERAQAELFPAAAAAKALTSVKGVESVTLSSGGRSVTLRKGKGKTTPLAIV